eukprot:scaffold24856_cov19-Tisochrysis_lutea.AAC.2
MFIGCPANRVAFRGIYLQYRRDCCTHVTCASCTLPHCAGCHKRLLYLFDPATGAVTLTLVAMSGFECVKLLLV